MRLPVVAPATFLDAIESLIDQRSPRARGPSGLSCRDFDRFERGSLRDVRDAMLTVSKGGAG